MLGTKAEYFVHKSAPYSHSFFWYGRFKKKSLVNKVLIFLEQMVLLTILSITISRIKYKVIINIYQPFKYYEFFLRILKFRNFERYIILHDVKEFSSNNYPNIIMSSNRRIIQFTDTVILHNHLGLFNELYSGKKELVTIPFPIRNSYSKVINCKFKEINRNYILFIGSYREEKGLDLLLNLKKGDLKNFVLVIAGNIPKKLEHSFIKKLESNVLIFNDNISDLDFGILISNASYGICPYKMGSNSGIYSTFLSNRIPTIISNTSIFDNFFVIDELKNKNDVDFSDIISSLPLSNSKVYRNYQENIDLFLVRRKDEFIKSIKSKLL